MIAMTPRSTAAVVLGLKGRIVFVSMPPHPGNPADDDYEIFTMEADGSDLKQLTSNSADEYSPFWSPDGTKIAFPGNLAIWVMNANGFERAEPFAWKITQRVNTRVAQLRADGMVAQREEICGDKVTRCSHGSGGQPAPCAR